MDGQEEYEIRQLSPLDVELDPENPRLERDERGASQESLRHTLVRRFKLDDLGESIVASGYTDIDPIVGFETEGHVRVKEGNRRIATLQLLLDPALAPERYRDRWIALSQALSDDTRAALASVDVRVYEHADAAAIEAYIGFRHVSGILEWPAQEKARFIVEMVDRQGWSYAELAKRIGSYPRHVERHYIASRIIEQARDDGLDGADLIRVGVLLRALQAGGISEFLGVEYPGIPSASVRPIPDANSEDFHFFVWATFGSEERDPVLPESRDLTKWGRILQEPAAVSYLKTSKAPRFDRAWLKCGGQEESLVELLNAAADALEDSLPLVPDFRENPEVVDAVDRCSRRIHQILRDFPALSAEACDGNNS